MLLVPLKSLLIIFGAMTKKSDPIFCKCSGHSAFQLRRVLVLDNEFWTTPLDLKGKEVWVNECGKPSVLTFNLYTQRCLDCLGWYSSPWETQCVECFRSDQSEQEHREPYRGWRWARRRMDEQRAYLKNLPKPLDTELDLTHSVPVGTGLV